MSVALGCGAAGPTLDGRAEPFGEAVTREVTEGGRGVATPVPAEPLGEAAEPAGTDVDLFGSGAALVPQDMTTDDARISATGTTRRLVAFSVALL